MVLQRYDSRLLKGALNTEYAYQPSKTPWLEACTTVEKDETTCMIRRISTLGVV